MTDPIADMLTRIRNASMVRKAEVVVPFSNIKLAIAQILEKEKYLTKVEVVEDKFKYLKLGLGYENNKPAITSIKRISKLGQRVYAGKDNLPRVLNNLGLAIVSTSRGLMTNKQARKAAIGGEIICEVY